MFSIKKKKKKKEQGVVSFSRLAFEALPEMWTAQFVIKISLLVMVGIFRKLVQLVIQTRAAAVTTSNLGSVFLGWQGIALLSIGMAFVLIYIAMDLFSQMRLSGDILDGKKARITENFKLGFQTIPRLLNPAGLSILAYVFIAVPLVGMGFSVKITENFHVPNFIMSVIKESKAYSTLYVLAIILLMIVGFLYLFSVHGIVLNGMSAKEAKKHSAVLMKKNWKHFLKSMAKVLLTCVFIQIAVFVVADIVPTAIISNAFSDIPEGYEMPHIKEFTLTDEEGVMEANGLTELDAKIIMYRFFSAFATLEGTYLDAIASLLSSAFVMLYFTKLFLLYDRRESKGEQYEEVFLERPKRSSYIWKIAAMIAIAGGLLLFSALMGVFYEEFMVRDTVPVIAHRCGGTLASENSIEGLRAAIAHGVYGSETDVQRTRDGYYVINHDDTFKRLAGVNKAPQDMTLSEIKGLRINDTTGNGGLLEVPTIDELLDVIKGKDILFIELKGKTADRQMVDDIVGIVKEHDCVDDVVLISLKYDVIDYAETAYPEFETGLLLFAGIGNIGKLNCDILITEEEMTSDSLISRLHNAGKKSMVWTVNKEDDLYEFLDRDVDGIITDEVELAEKVQKMLDGRNDMEVIRDNLGNLWE